jgi:hypothetical protein
VSKAMQARNFSLRPAESTRMPSPNIRVRVAPQELSVHIVDHVLAAQFPD